MSEFGPVIDYARIENAIRDQVILAWIDTYLVAIERENDLAPRTITRPRSWRVLDDLTITPEKNLPVIYVISAGDQEDPGVNADRTESSLIPIGVVVACKDTNRDTTRITTRRYAAAIAALVDHKLSEAGLGVQIASVPRQAFDERLNISTSNRPFAMGIAYVTFDVLVDGIRTRSGGPEEPFPAPDPGQDPPDNPADPEHTSTSIEVDVVEEVA